MKLRVLLPCLGIAGVIPIAYFFYARPVASDDIPPTEAWHPTHAEIVAAIGKSHGGKPLDNRQTQFARMFQQRYRDREHAVGIKFLADGRIKAMFAPLITRWDMARVSVNALDEAQDLFGEKYKVDIYETYITAPMKK